MEVPYVFGVMFFYVFSEIDKGIIEMQARISFVVEQKKYKF